MEVLPPLEVRTSDVYHQYRSELPTPRSSTSYTSLDSLSRTAEKSGMTNGSGSFRSISSYQKPSLPPIRDILKEPFASPPATPVTSRLPQHVSPVEYSSNPAKRPCTTSVSDRGPSHSSPAYPTTSNSAERRDSAIQQDYTYTRTSKIDRQRLGNSFLPELRTTGLDNYSPGQFTAASTGSATSRKRSFDRAMNSDDYDRPLAWGATPARTPNVNNRNSLQGPSPTTTTYTLLPSLSNEMLDSRYSDYQSQPRTQLPPPPNFSQGHAASSYAQYELASVKARKRSNLPKESTDVMKKWFDDHMDNPYPSEEEKKMFAAKACISLTQVSNWFINHRRRCPDLREARDKSKPLISRRSSDELAGGLAPYMGNP